jgi:hypothetical protein
MWRVWEGITYRDLVGKSRGRRTLGRLRHGCTENIKIYHNRLGFEKVDRIDQDQDMGNQRAVVKLVMNFQFQGHFLSS